MAKKHVTKNRVYQQRHRTETVRKEVVLNAAYSEDRAIIDFLSTLGRGEFSDVFREAMLLYIEHLDNPPRKVSDDFAEWMEVMFNGIQELRQRPVAQAERIIERVTERVTVSPAAEPMMIERPPTLPEDTPGAVVSSGISMSRPRPRKQLPRSQPAPQAEPEELTEADAIRLAKIMANSIRRAQPGRGG